jgi:hypothetical protein
VSFGAARTAEVSVDDAHAVAGTATAVAVMISAAVAHVIMWRRVRTRLRVGSAL